MRGRRAQFWPHVERTGRWTAEPRTQTALKNPRTPAVPATLEITIEEYYAAAALIGVLQAQSEEPAVEWVAKWSHDMGAAMADEARRRRKKPR